MTSVEGPGNRRKRQLTRAKEDMLTFGKAVRQGVRTKTCIT